MQIFHIVDRYLLGHGAWFRSVEYLHHQKMEAKNSNNYLVLILHLIVNVPFLLRLLCCILCHVLGLVVEKDWCGCVSGVDL